MYLNDLTPLSVAAQSIAGQKVCYGDIVGVNPILMKAVIIEIQGEVIHGSGAVLDHDAERMTALQSMGFDVFLVTHDMLNDKTQLDAIVKSVCSRLSKGFAARSRVCIRGRGGESFSKIVLASPSEFPYSTFSHGGVAQLGERLTGSQEVRGSIPLVSTRALNEAPTQVGAFFHIGTHGQRRHHDPPGRQDRALNGRRVHGSISRRGATLLYMEVFHYLCNH